MPIRKLPSVMFKNMKGALPDPCLRVRKNSGKRFVKNFFDPTTAFASEVGVFLNGGKRAKAETRKIRKEKFVKVCLW